VDDNNSNIFVMKSMITKFKIPCDAAYNGQQSVEMVSKLGLSNYRVVLMDINMPVMNGIDATQKIKELEAKGVISVVPVIACSAQEEEKVKSAAYEAGVVDFLEKPVSISKIEAIIKQYCQ
jgi:two-component system, sensor histidine kinase